MSINQIKQLKTEGNSVRFEAQSNEGRIHLEGTGAIVCEVSTDGEHYRTVEHEEEFDVNGVCEAPFKFYIGDRVRFSATTLTKAWINNENVQLANRK